MRACKMAEDAGIEDQGIKEAWKRVDHIIETCLKTHARNAGEYHKFHYLCASLETFLPRQK